MRAAIYARYSDDRQNERSIADQVALLRKIADQRGLAIVATFDDAAISGAFMVNRPGLQAMLAAAEAGAFDVLLVEDQSRIARNLEEETHIFNRLKRAGVRIATERNDQVRIIDVALGGLMSELYLDLLSDKTKRGMHSNAEKGLATGGRTYGYRTEPGGAMAIVPEEAEILREIFRRFGAGETLRAVVSDLNRRGVPGPAGGDWVSSTLAGTERRGSGIFRCELYVGVKVWNRYDVRKDPATGKRISHARPESEWRRVPVPHLRIVDDATWAAARARRAQRAATPPGLRHARPVNLFSGLMRCADCGASMTSYNSRKRLVCTARRERGPLACPNAFSVPYAEVEDRVLTGLRERLLSPEAVKAYVRAYHAAWQAKHAASASSIVPLRKRLGEAARTIERLVDKICEGLDTPATNARLAALEAEKVRLETELAAAERDAPPPVTLHPRAAEAFAGRVAALHLAFAGRADAAAPEWTEVVARVRDLTRRIDLRTIVAADGARIVEVTLHGALAGFIEAEARAAGLNKVVPGARHHLAQADLPTLKIAC